MSLENPFSTRFVRPGAITYRLPPGNELNALITRFKTIGRAGQIVGPHGGGKSTLLADLVRLWEQAGERVVVIELHDGQRRLPIRLAELQRDEAPTLIAVDGYEQLARHSQSSLRRFCHRNSIGLVVTTHRSMGIPDLVRCTPSLTLAESLVRHLMKGETIRISTDEIRCSFHRHDGNIREVLFEMYDLFESRS